MASVVEEIRKQVQNASFGRAKFEKRWQDRIFPGHVRIGPVTIYGANAMHWQVDIRTRWGYLCAHPTTRTFGGHWPWKVYLSRDATPQGVKETRHGFMFGGRGQ